MGLKSNNNAIIVDKCKSLQNLIVTLQLNANLITKGNNGFSLQLNCYPQTTPQAKYKGNPMYWMQFVIDVVSNSVLWGIQYWSHAGPYGPKGLGFSPAKNYSSFATAPSNLLRRGSVMRIALDTNASGKVTSVRFSLTNPDLTKVSSHKFTFPSNCLCAIYGFQVNLVGPASGTHKCTFTSAGGILTYQALRNVLAVQKTKSCGPIEIPTGETSNAVYGNVTPASGHNLSQTFTY